MGSAVPRCYVEERCGDGIDDDCDGVVDEDCDDATGGTDTGGPSAGDGGDDPGDGGDPDGGDAGALSDTFGELGDSEGCGCATEPRTAPTAMLMLTVLAVARRRRLPT